MTIIDERTAPPTPDLDEVALEAFADQVFGGVLGAMEMFAAVIGVRLGWYAALADGPMTPGELAAATDTDARYAQEWLEHQTVSSYLSVQDATAPAAERRYVISPEVVEVLVNRDSLSYMAPFPGFVVDVGRQLPDVIEAYRTGAGLSWDAHGDGGRCGQAEANRPMFLQLLGQEYLASIPDVKAALDAGGRVADVGCGTGWSSIGVAQAFPSATVDGFDIDGPSIEYARGYAGEHGVADRVRFHHVDAGTLDGHSGYDLVMALECVHDMPDPVSVLRSMRSMAAPDGTVIVMDERVGEHFTGEDDPVERFMYGFSLICCLPDGRHAPSSVATGTVMRPPTLERYAVEAGFDGIEILDIDNDFFRFYRLR